MSGRQRRPLVADTVPAHLAARLRSVRDESGLTLRQLADRSGYSLGALSSAESGRRVPSWELVEAHVQACGQDPAQWRQLWELAKANPQGAAGSADTMTVNGSSPKAAAENPALPPLSLLSPATNGTSTPRRRWSTRRLVVMVAVVAVVAGIAITAAVAFWPRSDQTQQPAADTVQPAKDDTDPYDDHCKADQKQLDWQPVSGVDGGTFGTLILMYSPACRAAWGYLQAPNSSQWTIHIESYRPNDKGQIKWQFSGDVPAGSWNNVLSTRPGCVYVEAYVATAGGTGKHARTACIQP